MLIESGSMVIKCKPKASCSVATIKFSTAVVIDRPVVFERLWRRRSSGRKDQIVRMSRTLGTGSVRGLLLEGRVGRALRSGEDGEEARHFGSL